MTHESIIRLLLAKWFSILDELVEFGTFFTSSIGIFNRDLSKSESNLQKPHAFFRVWSSDNQVQLSIFRQIAWNSNQVYAIHCMIFIESAYHDACFDAWRSSAKMVSELPKQQNMFSVFFRLFPVSFSNLFPYRAGCHSNLGTFQLKTF